MSSRETVAIAQTEDYPLALGSDSAVSVPHCEFSNSSLRAHYQDIPRRLQEEVDCLLRRISGIAARHLGPPTATEVGEMTRPHSENQCSIPQSYFVWLGSSRQDLEDL